MPARAAAHVLFFWLHPQLDIRASCAGAARCRVYALKPPASGRKSKVSQYLLPAGETAKDLYCAHTLSKRPMGAAEGGAKPATHPLFADERVNTFFRRPAWSPDGEVAGSTAVVSPRGLVLLYGPHSRLLVETKSREETQTKLPNWPCLRIPSASARACCPPHKPPSRPGSLLVLPAGLYKPSAEGKELNTAYVYARGQWAAPIMHLPGHPKVRAVVT